MENKPDQKVLRVLALIHSGFLPTLMDVVSNKIGNTSMSRTLKMAVPEKRVTADKSLVV